ncbi:uncharacterized protein [Littorina saxatilis]|uniref:Uncharacterized protein n=1 Tax=Littorina saxatilis TaxID=31220 RepID=A0AAN9ALE7_9CAEN
MRTAIFVVLLLSAVCIGSSDAGWLRRAWENVKNAVRDVVDWVKSHCSVGTGGVSCEFNRRRRDVHNVPDNATLESENKLCDKILHDSIILQQGFTFDLIKDVFEEVDRGHSEGNGDDILEVEEFSQFMEALEVLHFCFSRAE